MSFFGIVLKSIKLFKCFNFCIIDFIGIFVYCTHSYEGHHFGGSDPYIRIACIA